MSHFVSGWKHLPEELLLDKSCELFISVVIAFRDEEKVLPQLLERIATQTHQAFELILVNDHSTDNSLQTIAAFSDLEEKVHLVEAIGTGKKNALKEGIVKAKGKLIVCTDADCLPTENWIKSIAQFQERENCDLIICPVRMSFGDSFFSKMQTLEFTSLITTGAGAAASKTPVLCNGANLAFTPKVWQESLGDLKEKETSGDDMFLMMSVKKRGGKIRFLKSTAAIVETASCETLSDFFNQRKRWASKSKSYRDFQVIVLALLVFGICSAMVASLVVGFFNPIFWKAVVFLFLLKILTDISLLMASAKFFSTEKLLIYIPFLEIIYPFYVVGTALSGLFGKFSWKGRTN